MDDIKILQNKLLEMLTDFDQFCQENGILYSLEGGNVIGAVRHKGFIPWDDDVDVQMTRDNYDKFLSLYKNNEKYYLQKDTVDYPLQFSKIRANNTAFIEDIPYKGKYKNLHQGIFLDIFPVDKVSTDKIKAKKQAFYSNIVTAQSLFLRGYPKSHNSLKKQLIMWVSVLLLPFRKIMIEYVKKFNDLASFEKYCSYYSCIKKVYQDKSCYAEPYVKLLYEGKEFPVINNYEKYLTDYYGDYMAIPSAEEIEYKIHAKIVDVNESYLKYLK